MKFTRFLPVFICISISFFFIHCNSVFDDSAEGEPFEEGPHLGDPLPSSSTVFAVIGDYGNDSDEEGEVAEMVKSWNPEFVITLGDNNYSDGELETIEENVGQYYCDFIYNPDAPEHLRCNGAATQEKRNRFFPSLGNHDVRTDDGEPYYQYFTLPGNERYYDFTWGSVHLFVIDSATDEDEDLECCDNPQAIWLKDRLAASSSSFNLVYFHHPPYSTGDHGSNDEMQWPFEEWGAHAVLCGHDHIYERIHKIANPEFPYFICGVGGKSDKDCGKEDLENEDDFDVTCIDDIHGAMRVIATPATIRFQLFSIEQDDEAPLDEFLIRK